MDTLEFAKSRIDMPENFVVFISGVPGTGKTTVSYELLKRCYAFRIIEETDLIREILRGYRDYLKEKHKEKVQFLFDEVDLADHRKFLSINDAKRQCEIMKKSLEMIVARQQRKGIPTIINGVHIVPEVLAGLGGNRNIIYINLFIRDESKLYERWSSRDPHKYALKNIPLQFETNCALYIGTGKLAEGKMCLFNNIDVTDLSIEQTIDAVLECIKVRIECTC